MANATLPGMKPLQSVVDLILAAGEPFIDGNIFLRSPVWPAFVTIIVVEFLASLLQIPAYRTLAVHMGGGSGALSSRLLTFLSGAALLKPMLAVFALPFLAYVSFAIMLLSGSWTTFRTAFSMIVAAQVPTAVSAIVAGITLYLRAPYVTQPGDFLIYTGLDAFVPMNTSLAMAVAGTLSIYMVWSIAIFVRMGLRRGLKLSSVVLASSVLWAPGFVLLLLSKPVTY